MIRDLSVEEGAQRREELLALWMMFDPQALGPDAAAAAYADHVEPLLRVLEGGGDEQELATEVRIIMQDFMNLDWSTQREAEAEVFATRVAAWWRSNWPDTRG